MKLSLILFIVGVLFIFIGYSHQIKPYCEKDKKKIEYIDESQYNLIINNNDNSASMAFNQM